MLSTMVTCLNSFPRQRVNPPQDRSNIGCWLAPNCRDVQCILVDKTRNTLSALVFGVQKLFVSAYPADPIFVPTLNLFCWCSSTMLQHKYDFRYIGACSPTYFKLTFIYCHIPHEFGCQYLPLMQYVLSHLELTNGCTVKR